MTDDLISRQAEIDALHTQFRDGFDGDKWWNSTHVLAVIESLPSAQRWIPVTERLPEYGIEVVTVDKDGDYEINHIIDKEDGEWYWRGTIAWMPLPEPWKGEV